MYTHSISRYIFDVAVKFYINLTECSINKERQTVLGILSTYPARVFYTHMCDITLPIYTNIADNVAVFSRSSFSLHSPFSHFSFHEGKKGEVPKASSKRRRGNKTSKRG